MSADECVDVAGTRRHSTALPASTLSAWRARQFVASVLRGAHCQDLTIFERLAIVTSELVTNAVIHTRTAIELRMTVDPGSVYLEILDGSPERPERRAPALGETSGRGLVLVDALVDDWGVKDLDDGLGKLVWIRLDAA